MRDSQGRNIDYLRVSVTDRCNLRCIYCMPGQGIEKKKHDDILRYEDIVKIVKAASVLDIKKVRYTGGEPLIMRNFDRLIYETASINGIEDIALTTNGILLDDMAEDLKKAGLKRVNISLDTLDKNKFKEITRIGNLDKVLAGIDKCINSGLNPVKINAVLMKGINDTEIDDFINFIREFPVEVRFIELMPIGEGTKLYEKSKMGFKEVLDVHPELTPMKSKPGSTAELYTVRGARGKIGFISPISCKFCSDCNRIRLTSTGTIKPCLHSKDEISIKEYLDNEVMLTAVLKEAILNKPSEHHLEDEKKSRSTKTMYQIGG
ncbi:MAG: GTP 3',8-cyclase MoaA [Clostridiaceae bacterium]